MSDPRPRRLSLLKPTGHLTLGNLLGALRPMAAAVEHGECYYGVADLHALTTPHEPARIRDLTNEMCALLLAAGLDPDRCTLFVQSRVPAHSELAYLLECTATTGELNRMIQFKEKGRGQDSTRASLFTYPALMAADILLYGASEVPVGADQSQHVELTRDLAERFNRLYGDTFVVPRVVNPVVGARVMDLQEPTTKMGKSHESGAGIVYLLDGPDVVVRKIRRAVTDSEGEVRYDRVAKPGVSNLLDIAAGCSGRSVEAIAAEATTYGTLKQVATQHVLEVLAPIQQAYGELSPHDVKAVFDAGSARARDTTAPVLAAARAAMGLA